SARAELARSGRRGLTDRARRGRRAGGRLERGGRTLAGPHAFPARNPRPLRAALGAAPACAAASARSRRGTVGIDVARGARGGARAHGALARARPRAAPRAPAALPRVQIIAAGGT